MKTLTQEDWHATETGDLPKHRAYVVFLVPGGNLFDMGQFWDGEEENKAMSGVLANCCITPLPPERHFYGFGTKKKWSLEDAKFWIEIPEFPAAAKKPFQSQQKQENHQPQ